jgi:hypothetical protein
MVPLLHSNLLPDLIHVYLSPETVFICPLVLQVAPAFTAAKAGTERNEPINARAIRIARDFFLMSEIIL